ncbi:MAG: hypothetical protein KGJ78_13125 [Alphaproteobacteria bacterium]|nr:hypothetical protein [Alphaproteobacteria bacterium]
MRTATLVLAGIAAIGLAGLALAEAPAVHELTVQIPDGGVAHIRYTGDIAPTISVDSQLSTPDSFQPAFFEPAPFAELDRISALMDQQMNAMLIQAQQLDSLADPNGLSSAALKDMPMGATSYSFISDGSAFCARSVEVMRGAGGKTKVVSHTSGNCGSSNPAAQSSGDNANFKTIAAKTRPSLSKPARI